MSRADELRAELDLMELEAKFVQAKKSGKATPKQRAELREARRAFRERRAGSAAASPEAIETKTGVQDGRAA